jgi:hypothetical protein
MSAFGVIADIVQPGQTAKVSAQRSVGLSLSGSGTLSPIQQGTPRRSLADPAPVTKEQERRSAADSTQNEWQIDEASLHREGESIPASPRKNAANQNKQLSPSINPIQVSPVQVSKEDRSAPDSAPRTQHVVASLLTGDSRNEGVSKVVALRQSVDNANNSSKPDDSMAVVLIVGTAVFVTLVVGAQRRRKRQNQCDH